MVFFKINYLRTYGIFKNKLKIRHFENLSISYKRNGRQIISKHNNVNYKPLKLIKKN